MTGASAGIGEAFALRLAAQGTHLVLVARDERRLEELAMRCRRDHGVEVEIIAADLCDQEQVASVEQRLVAAPAIDLLVNNAGIGTFGTFGKLELNDELRQIDLNISAVVRLTHAAVVSMRADDAGTVLNVSSVLALQPSPGSATYGATKAFVTSFSEALHEELRGTGIGVTAVMPGLVRTQFQERAGKGEEFGRVPGFAWLSPDAVAKDALDAARRGRALSVPGHGYKLAAAMMGSAPRSVLRRTAGIVARRFP